MLKLVAAVWAAVVACTLTPSTISPKSSQPNLAQSAAETVVVWGRTKADAVVKRITGPASYYGKQFHGRLTANGERFNMDDLTAAHRSLPFGTVIRVTNLLNGMHTYVRVNDRGPYIDGRVIDLSQGAARTLNMIETGVANVKLEILS